MYRLLRGIVCSRRPFLGALLLVLIFACPSSSQAQGNLWAWGGNLDGQLGNGTTTGSNSPVSVLGPDGVGFLSGVIQIGENYEESVVIRNDGTVWAWGYNLDGELGNGLETDSSLPVQAAGAGLPAFSQILVGWYGCLSVSASSDNGNVYGWGNNSAGNLGNGTTNESDFPSEVLGPDGISPPLESIVQVVTDQPTVWALKSDGTVWAWGTAPLGDGTTNSSTTPVQIVGPNGVGFLTGITQLAPGGNLALKNDGTIWSWGGGPLGNGTSTGSNSPVEVVGENGVGFLTGVVTLVSPTMIIKSDGSVWDWGSGPLGNSTTASSTTPVEVVGPNGAGFLTGITQVVQDTGFSLALRNDGTVWAWGTASAGQLGNGTDSSSNAPVQVIGPGGTGYLTGIVGVQVGHETGTCYARAADGTFFAWGFNNLGAVGDGTTTNRSAPVLIAGIGHNVSIAASGTGVGGPTVLALSGYDLAWENTQTGATTQWLVNESTRISASPIVSDVAPNWKMVGAADFLGNGFGDILWQNESTGEIGFWKMNAGQFVNYVQIAPPGFVPTTWQIVGTGNISGNATIPNILWQNTTTGELGYWNLNTSFHYQSYTQVVAPGIVPLEWRVAGTPDFTGTGTLNILWQNSSTGEIGYWTSDFGGTFRYTQIEPAGVVPTEWRVGATPDIDGDGHSDIVWQNETTGEVGYWLMSNGQRVSYTQISAPGVISTAWRIGASL